MPLTDYIKNEILNNIAIELKSATISKLTIVNGPTYFYRPDLPTKISYPQSLGLVWSDARYRPNYGSITTTNRPSTNNALIFAINEDETAKTIMLRNATTNVGVMTLDGDVAGGQYGSGLLLQQLKITLTEV